MRQRCPTCKKGEIVRLVGILSGGSPVFAELCWECEAVLRCGRIESPRVRRRSLVSRAFGYRGSRVDTHCESPEGDD